VSRLTVTPCFHLFQCCPG